MDTNLALDLSREALLVTLLVAAPVLAVGLVVGLVISILQTVTQIQDQTLSIVPKIVAMLGAALLLVPWLTQRIVEYSQKLFGAS
jgi:flagellar biosynthetic protein FliQ